MALLYILIGCLWCYNNHRIMTLDGKKDIFPFWYHVVAGALWPACMITTAWFMYKKWRDGNK